MKKRRPKAPLYAWVQEKQAHEDNRLAIGVSSAASGRLNRAEHLLIDLKIAYDGTGCTAIRLAIACRPNRRHARIITNHLNGFQQLNFAF
jgi:hypothetical protein